MNKIPNLDCMICHFCDQVGTLHNIHEMYEKNVLTMVKCDHCNSKPHIDSVFTCYDDDNLSYCHLSIKSDYYKLIELPRLSYNIPFTGTHYIELGCTYHFRYDPSKNLTDLSASANDNHWTIASFTGDIITVESAYTKLKTILLLS